MSERDAQTRLIAREGGGTWVAQVMGLGLRYVAMYCATHALGSERFGDYTLTFALTSVATTLSLVGLAPGALPFLSRARRDGDPEEIRAVVRSALLPVVAVALLLAATLYALAPWLAIEVFGKPGLLTFLRPLSWLVALGGVSAILFVLLQGFMAVKERAWIERVVTTGVTAAGLALVWQLELGSSGVVGATLAGAAAGLVGAVWLLAKRAPGVLDPQRPAANLRVREMLAYSWPLMGTSMLALLLVWTDVLMMGGLRESGEVGVYGACARLAPAIMIVHESIGPVFVARLSDLYVRKDWGAIEHLYRLTARWAMWPGLVAAWILVLWGGELLSLFGEEFAAGAAVLSMLSLGRVVASSTGMSGRVLGITGRARLNLVNMLLLMSTNVALNLAWIPVYGGLGAAGATTVSLALVKTLQVIEIRVLYRILPWDRASLIPLFGITALAGLSWPLRAGLDVHFGWLLPIALFVTACAALFGLLGLSEEDRVVWRALRKRTGR